MKIYKKLNTNIYEHTSVMPKEILTYLNCKPGNIIVDATLGGLGHSQLISKKIEPNGILIGIDQDIDAINNAKKFIQNKSIKKHIIHSNFLEIDNILKKINIPLVNGIIVDLGVSFNQINNSQRGFTFLKDEPLDMRMNKKNQLTATKLLETIKKEELTKLLWKYGEEKWAKRIAHNLVKFRKKKPITTSKQLCDIINLSIPKNTKNKKIHPATRVFMALRIIVNKELETLNIFLKKSIKLLKPKGRICVLSFHSLEDRIVKQTFKSFVNPCICPNKFPICICNKKPLANIITKKAIRPSLREINRNHMSRTSKLRVIEKI